MSSSAKLPSWFWVVAVLAVVWNIFGVLAYLGDVTAGEEALAKMSAEQREMFENRPSWLIGSYAIAVFSGLAAAALLLWRKALAVPLFAISLAAVASYRWAMSFSAWVHSQNSALPSPSCPPAFSYWALESCGWPTRQNNKAGSADPPQRLSKFGVFPRLNAQNRYSYG